MLKDKTVLAVGNRKAYEMLSNYVGLCELSRATGKAEFLQAARYAWEDVNAKRLYITGGSSAGEHFHPDGHLPNDADAHIQEMCVTTTWMQLCWQLSAIDGRGEVRGGPRTGSLQRDAGSSEAGRIRLRLLHSPGGTEALSPRFPGPREMDCCNWSGPRHSVFRRPSSAPSMQTVSRSTRLPRHAGT